MQQQNKNPHSLPQPSSLQSQSSIQQNPTISLFDTTLIFNRRNSEHKRKGIDQILQKLHKNQSSAIQSQTTLLKRRRHRIQKQLSKVYYKPIQQPDMKPGDAVLRIFSSMKPINTGDRFLNQKQRARLVFSDRVYTRKPNVVTGVYQKRVQTQTDMLTNVHAFTYNQKQLRQLKSGHLLTQTQRIKTQPSSSVQIQKQIAQKKDWINRKFKQYDKIVTEQTGPLRLLHKKLSQAQNGINCKHSIMSSVNHNQNNLFSAFESSKNDFYYDYGKQNTVSTNAFSFRSSRMMQTGGRGVKGEANTGMIGMNVRLGTQRFQNTDSKTYQIYQREKQNIKKTMHKTQRQQQFNNNNNEEDNHYGNSTRLLKQKVKIINKNRQMNNNLNNISIRRRVSTDFN